MALSKKSIERLLHLAEHGWAAPESAEVSRLVARCRKELLPQQKKAKGGRSSRNKGLAGERAARDYLREQGFPEATRGLGQSRGGGKEAADCINIGDLHVEVKRVERLNVHAALAQAENDAGGAGRWPIVLHRRNGDKGWKVTCWADDFFSIYRDAEGIEPEEDSCSSD
jgi:hypothetical protein